MYQHDFGCYCLLIVTGCFSFLRAIKNKLKVSLIKFAYSK